MTMETLVVSQHRNQYYGRVRSYGPGRSGSLPSRSFREINCRTFQSGTGLLPTPYKYNFDSVTKQAASYRSASLPSLKTLSPGANSDNVDITCSPKTPAQCAKSNSVDVKEVKTTGRSSPIAINKKSSSSKSERSLGGKFPGESFSFSELWAGPAYSNSPPPSSLPMPKFSFKAKRTVSLDLPASDHVVDIHPISKSAPASPSRDSDFSSAKLFPSADSATKTLRRILNLDVADD